MQIAIKQILEERKKQNLNRQFVEIQKNFKNPSNILANGKSAVNFCSNDYLRLSLHPEVCKAMLDGVNEYGVGSGGTRNISGTNTPHHQLENIIAKMHNKGRALLFSSAYAANVGALFAIGKYLPNVIFFSDEKNHASIVHGINYSAAKKVIYKHNDLQNLEECLIDCLAQNSKNCIPVIVCEGVYSMSGTVTDLKKLKEIAIKYGAMIYLDEVHCVGIYGKGKGLSAEQGVEIDIINGTLGKAFGVFGGYISASDDIVDFVKSFATTFIFSTSLPPSLCMAAIEAIKIATTQNNMQEKFWQNILHLKNQLQKLNIDIINTKSHIISVKIGREGVVKEISQKMLEMGFYVQPIFYPTVALGKAILRVTISPFHTILEINEFTQALKLCMN